MTGPRLTAAQLMNAAEARKFLDMIEGDMKLTIIAGGDGGATWDLSHNAEPYQEAAMYALIKKYFENVLTDLGLSP